MLRITTSRFASKNLDPFKLPPSLSFEISPKILSTGHCLVPTMSDYGRRSSWSVYVLCTPLRTDRPPRRNVTAALVWCGGLGLGLPGESQSWGKLSGKWQPSLLLSLPSTSWDKFSKSSNKLPLNVGILHHNVPILERTNSIIVAHH